MDTEDARRSVAECERLAEAAYEAMYEARPHRVKDLYEEARGHFVHAIETAWAGRLYADALRLSARLAEVDAVYNGQFRGIG